MPLIGFLLSTSCFESSKAHAPPAQQAETIDRKDFPSQKRTEEQQTAKKTVPQKILSVIPKAAWGSEVSADKCKPHTIKHISIHHTASNTTKNKDAPRRIRGHQRYHQSKGWMDIAYHFVVDLNGNIYQGRDPSCIGDTATNYDPSNHLLIVLEGNFEKQDVSQAAWLSLVQLIAWGQETYKIPSSQVFTHRDLAQTACPGKKLFAKIESVLLSELKHQQNYSWSMHIIDVEEGEAILRNIQKETPLK